MKAKIDPNFCAGVGACETTCPEVFQVKGDTSTVIADPVPPEAEDKCRQAAKSCPMSAISIEE